MKTKLINQTGFIIKGLASVSLWGGGQGDINIEPCFLPFNKCTPKNILRCVNDSGFGCESIDSAEIEIWTKYDNGSIEFDRSLFVDNPIHTQYFLGWKELKEQGIN